MRASPRASTTAQTPCRPHCSLGADGEATNFSTPGVSPEALFSFASVSSLPSPSDSAVLLSADQCHAASSHTATSDGHLAPLARYHPRRVARRSRRAERLFDSVIAPCCSFAVVDEAYRDQATATPPCRPTCGPSPATATADKSTRFASAKSETERHCEARHKRAHPALVWSLNVESHPPPAAGDHFQRYLAQFRAQYGLSQ